MVPRKDKDQPKYKWKIDSELALIREVQRRPVLWDCTLEIYRRTDLKSKAFEEVTQAVDESTNDYNITSQIAAERWKSMKSTYAENERRIREFKNKCSGSGADDVYQPKWVLYKYLQFLTKAVAQAESTSNINNRQIDPPQFHSQIVSPQASTIPVNVNPQSSPPSVYFDDDLNAFMSIPADSACASNNPPDNVSIGDIENDIFSKNSISSPTPTPLPDARVMSPPESRPVSTPPSVKRKTTAFYESRGKKNKNASVDEALQMMRIVAAQPIPELPNDSATSFGSLVANRLREIEEENGKGQRRRCEIDLMAVLTKY